jgi:hypothetical protein
MHAHSPWVITATGINQEVLLMDFESSGRSGDPADSVERDSRSVLIAPAQIHWSIASCVRHQTIDCG